jgi:hypothetical protein
VHRAPKRGTIFFMSLIGLIIVLIIVGALLYIVQTVLPIDARIKTIITVIVIVGVCLWLLQALGLVSDAPIHLRR